MVFKCRVIKINDFFFLIKFSETNLGMGAFAGTILQKKFFVKKKRDLRGQSDIFGQVIGPDNGRFCGQIAFLVKTFNICR